MSLHRHAFSSGIGLRGVLRTLESSGLKVDPTPAVVDKEDRAPPSHSESVQIAVGALIEGLQESAWVGEFATMSAGANRSVGLELIQAQLAIQQSEATILKQVYLWACVPASSESQYFQGGVGLARARSGRVCSVGRE